MKLFILRFYLLDMVHDSRAREPGMRNVLQEVSRVLQRDKPPQRLLMEESKFPKLEFSDSVASFWTWIFFTCEIETELDTRLINTVNAQWSSKAI